MLVILTQPSPQISASVPRYRHPPLRWEHCSTPPPLGTVTYTWNQESTGDGENDGGHMQISTDKNFGRQKTGWFVIPLLALLMHLELLGQDTLHSKLSLILSCIVATVHRIHLSKNIQV